MFPHRWSIDQWRCGLYGFVLPPWHCTLPAGLTELPVFLECPRRDRLALGFLDCLHKRSLVTATSWDSVCVHVWVLLFLLHILLTSLHLLSLSLPLCLPPPPFPHFFLFSPWLLSVFPPLPFCLSPSLHPHPPPSSPPPTPPPFDFLVCGNFYLPVCMHECNWCVCACVRMCVCACERECVCMRV